MYATFLNVLDMGTTRTVRKGTARILYTIYTYSGNKYIDKQYLSWTDTRGGMYLNKQVLIYITTTWGEGHIHIVCIVSIQDLSY